MVRWTARNPRSLQSPAHPQVSSARTSTVAVVAMSLLTGFALIGCSSASRDAMSTSGSPGSGAAVAPAERSGQSVAPVAPATDSAGNAGSKSSPSSSTAPSSSAPGGAPDAPLPTVGDARQIIRNGSADLEVKSVADAFESVRQIATAAGGMVADSNYMGSGDKQTGSLTLRVPVDRFGDVLAKLREVAVTVHSISTGSSDVTAEYTDIEATIRNLRAVEAQYTTLLARASSISDILTVQDRLNSVRLQIDRTEARRQSLASRSEMSTITVTLRPVAAGAVTPGTGAMAQARAAWNDSLETLALIGTTLMVLAITLWWLIPFALVGAVVLYRLIVREQQRLRRETPPSAPVI